MTKFFVTRDRLFRTYSGLCSDQHLIILQSLVREVNQLGGAAGALDPDRTASKPAKQLTLPVELEKILKHALVSLPASGTSECHLRTKRAVGRIVRTWRGKRGFVSLTPEVPESARYEPRANVSINLQKLDDFRQRDLAVSFNSCHPKATRLYSAEAKLSESGQLYVVLTFGYPRDSSSWDVSYYDTDRHAPTWAEVGAKLIQKEDEDGPVALSRIVSEIEKILVPVPDSMRSGYYISAAHREAIRREEAFNQLSAQLRESSRGAYGGFSVTYNLRSAPDAGTKERFGFSDEQPHSLAEEVASMLADQLTRENTTDAEMTILADGLKLARRFKVANQQAQAFTRSTANRNWGNLRDREQPAPGPNYEALDACVAETAHQKGTALVWIPGGGEEGLIRVDLSTVKFDRRWNTITYDGRKMDVGVIRQIDCLPAPQL